MSWLSLKVPVSPKAGVFISIPKKVVKRAVDRNRLKRLIREAVRGDIFFSQKKSFFFKVTKSAPGIGCAEVKQLVLELKKAVGV